MKRAHENLKFSLSVKAELSFSFGKSSSLESRRIFVTMNV